MLSQQTNTPKSNVIVQCSNKHGVFFCSTPYQLFRIKRGVSSLLYRMTGEAHLFLGH